MGNIFEALQTASSPYFGGKKKEKLTPSPLPPIHNSVGGIKGSGDVFSSPAVTEIEDPYVGSQRFGTTSSLEQSVDNEEGGMLDVLTSSFSHGFSGTILDTLTSDEERMQKANRAAAWEEESNAVGSFLLNTVGYGVSDLPLILATGGLGSAGVALEAVGAARGIRALSVAGNSLRVIGGLGSGNLGKNVMQRMISEGFANGVQGLVSAKLYDAGHHVDTADYTSAFIMDAIFGGAIHGLGSVVSKAFSKKSGRKNPIEDALKRLGVKDNVRKEVIDELRQANSNVVKSNISDEAFSGKDMSGNDVVIKNTDVTDHIANGGSVEFKGNHISGTVDESWRSSPKLAALAQAVDANGTKVVFVKDINNSSPSINGEYGNGVVVVKVVDDEAAMVRTLGHELVHSALDKLPSDMKVELMKSFTDVLNENDVRRGIPKNKVYEDMDFRDITEEFLSEIGGDRVGKKLNALMKNMSDTARGSSIFDKFIKSIKSSFDSAAKNVSERLPRSEIDKAKLFIDDIIDASLIKDGNTDLHDFLSGKTDKYMGDISRAPGLGLEDSSKASVSPIEGAGFGGKPDGGRGGYDENIGQNRKRNEEVDDEAFQKALDDTALKLDTEKDGVVAESSVKPTDSGDSVGLPDDTLARSEINNPSAESGELNRAVAKMSSDNAYGKSKPSASDEGADFKDDDSTPNSNLSDEEDPKIDRPRVRAAFSHSKSEKIKSKVLKAEPMMSDTLDEVKKAMDNIVINESTGGYDAEIASVAYKAADSFFRNNVANIGNDGKIIDLSVDGVKKYFKHNNNIAPTFESLDSKFTPGATPFSLEAVSTVANGIVNAMEQSLGAGIPASVVREIHYSIQKNARAISASIDLAGEASAHSQKLKGIASSNNGKLLSDRSKFTDRAFAKHFFATATLRNIMSYLGVKKGSKLHDSIYGNFEKSQNVEDGLHLNESKLRDKAFKDIFKTPEIGLKYLAENVKSIGVTARFKNAYNKIAKGIDPPKYKEVDFEFSTYGSDGKVNGASSLSLTKETLLNLYGILRMGFKNIDTHPEILDHISKTGILTSLDDTVLKKYNKKTLFSMYSILDKSVKKDDVMNKLFHNVYLPSLRRSKGYIDDTVASSTGLALTGSEIDHFPIRHLNEAKVTDVDGKMRDKIDYNAVLGRDLNNKEPILLVPAIDAVSHNTNGAIRHAAWRNTLARFHDTFNNASVTKDFRDVFGKDIHKWVADLTNDIIDPTRMAANKNVTDTDKVLRFLYNAQTYSALALNPKIAATQYVSTLFFRQDYGKEIFNSTMGKNMSPSAIKSIANEIEKHANPTLVARVTGSGRQSADIADVFSHTNSLLRDATGGSSILGKKNAAELSMFGIEAVDTAAIVKSWEMAKKWVVKNGVEENSPDFWKAVSDKVQDTVNRSQPTHYTWLRTAYQRTDSQILRQVTGRFTSATSKVMSVLNDNINEVRLSGGKDKAVNKKMVETMSVLLASGLALGLSSVLYKQAALKGGGDRDIRKAERRGKKLIKLIGLDTVNRILGISLPGQIVSKGIGAVSGENQYGYSIAGFDAVTDMTRFLSASSRYLSGNSRGSDAVIDATLNFGMDTMGIPQKNVRDTFKAIGVAPLRSVFGSNYGK